MRVARACHVARYAAQIKLQHARINGGFQVVRPQPCGFGVGFHQFHLRVLASGQFQIIDGLRVDGEHGGSRAELRRHVGNGRAVADGQASCALAEKFDKRPDHAFFAQKLGQCQHNIRRGNARLTFARQLHADNIRQAHHGRASQHHRFRFQTAHAHGNHAQRIDVRRMRVRSDAGIGERHAVFDLDDGRHFFQIDLVHDAVARRNHVHIFKSGFRPVDKVETVFVAPVFNFAVFAERIRIVAAAFHRQRVVDDKLRLHHRIHFGRIAALLCNRIAQARQIHQRGLPQNIVAHHPRGIPRKIDFLLAFYQLDQPALQRRQIDFVRAVDQVLRQNAARVRQLVVRAGLNVLTRRTRVVVFQIRTGQRFAVTLVGSHVQFSCGSIFLVVWGFRRRF